MSRIRSATAILSLAALLSAGCSGGHDPGPAPAEPGQITAHTAVAASMAVAVEATASGTAEAWRTSRPATKLMGRVAELFVREGDRVRAGQTVARIESADLEAGLAQAHAALQMAEATLENAAAQHARMERLHADRSVTDKALEDATAAHRVAAANLEVMRSNVRAAEVALSYAEVTTPVSGWVTARMIEAGDMAAPGQPLVTVQDLSRMKLRVEVPESAVARLAEGDPATVTVSGRELTVDIDRIVHAGDAATRTFSVEMVVDNTDGAIRDGMFVRASFPTGQREALHVPLTAIVVRGQLAGVYVVDADGRARLRWVKPGSRDGEQVEILSGLEPGERYLVAPPPTAYDGVRVEGF